MSSLITTKKNYTSKKARQNSLKEKIELIDAELDKLGVVNIKYRVLSAINNFETQQNTINISNITDPCVLVRQIAYYKNINETGKALKKDHPGLEKFSIKTLNGVLVTDILHDLNLRLCILLNEDKIKILNESKEKLLPFLDEESRFTNALKEIDQLIQTTLTK